MTESIITISIVGLLTGFIFSMPIAGPISILITTNAFKGRLRYCNLVSIGSSLGTFTYAFLAVYGLAKLYRLYQPAIPYLLTIGSVFLVFLGYRIFRTKFDIEQLEEQSHINEKIKKKHTGGFYTGLIINFLNPTLFIGWLTSTFLVISFVSSLGFDTGGLNKFVKENVREIGSIEYSTPRYNSVLSLNNSAVLTKHEIQDLNEEVTGSPRNFHLMISVFYALFVAAGSITWFYILALSITRFRRYINFKYISVFIRFMGLVLCFIGLYFAYMAVSHHQSI
jgi:threonine/homoserine/homoserine lactone efflux protein